MPFYLSFFSFLASCLWMAYGLLSHDLFLAVCIFYLESFSFYFFINSKLYIDEYQLQPSHFTILKKSSSFLLLQSPNLVGTPLCILQLILYCKYRKNPIKEKPQKWPDLEYNEEKIKQEFPLDEIKESKLIVTENLNTKI